MKLRVCRDVTLASERILFVEVFHRRFYAWVDGSPAVDYRVHVSRYLVKDWWLITKSGQHSRQVPARGRRARLGAARGQPAGAG
ncbi:MAG: hypothetical protein ABJB47_10730 [Actinomycetota bacterium]